MTGEDILKQELKLYPIVCGFVLYFFILTPIFATAVGDLPMRIFYTRHFFESEVIHRKRLKYVRVAYNLLYLS